MRGQTTVLLKVRAFISMLQVDQPRDGVDRGRCGQSASRPEGSQVVLIIQFGLEQAAATVVEGGDDGAFRLPW